MATTSFYLDMRRRSAKQPGDLNVVIRHNNEAAFIAIDNVHLFREQWDGEKVIGRPDRTMLNTVIAKRKADIDAAIFSLSLSHDLGGMSAAQLKEAVRETVYPGQDRSRKPKKPKDLFVPYYERFAQRRNAKGTTDLYMQTLKKIRDFDPDIDGKCFTDITKTWLEDFDDWLKATNSTNIRNRQLRNIRAVFNDAIDSEVTEHYPFRKFKMPKLEQTRKRALSIDQIKQLRDYPCMDWQKEYVDMFLLSFYLIGINMVDLLTAKKEDVRDGRLEYRRDKTGHLYSVKLEPEAVEIISRYPGEEWLLSPMDRYGNHKNYILRMNRALKKVGLHYTTSTEKTGKAILPEISTYWARHSWASIAAGADMPMEIIGRALGHSWVTRNITSVYIDFDNRKVDAANRAVLDLLR